MKHLISISMILILLCSCSHKEYLYLADMSDDAGYVIANKYQARVQPDDRLRITVSCKNPELAAPFNVSTGAVRVNPGGEVSAASSSGDNTYRVDAGGDISFPVLGELHVGGLTVNQAIDLIRDRIIEGNYIKDPIVSLELLNFHYTVLGAVNGNGTYRADGDKVTILEAIAKAGDLSSEADLGKIAVIREQDGRRQIYTLDIRSSDIFNSPAFYLSQNDIVYARPKKPKSNGNSTLPWISVAMSAISAVTSILWVTLK